MKLERARQMGAKDVSRDKMGYINNQFALIQPGGAVGERLNK